MCKENNQSKTKKQINHLQMDVQTKHSKWQNTSLSCATNESQKISPSYAIEQTMITSLF
jgi:hypothetical protein